MTDGGWLASGPLFGLPLADLWFALLFFILGTFLFLDGFDFGVGVLFATRKDDEARETLLAAIGPFWDGNEVWLVVFGGALFAAFPSVYAGLFSRQYLLMFAILLALIVRGLAPEMYEQREDERWKRWWGRAFVGGSAASPLLLGLFVGNWLLGSTRLVTLPSVLVGLAVLSLAVVDGVAYLRLKTRGELRDGLKSTGYLAIVAYLVAVVAAITATYIADPGLRSAVRSRVAIGLVLLTVVLAAGFVVATRRNRVLVAFVAVAGLVFALVALVATLMYPVIDRGAGVTVGDAIVSTVPLNLMSVGAAVLLPLVFVYFAVLYSAFSGPVEAGEGY